MPGFFDLSDPDNAALLGMASGLLQAGAPSRLPVPPGVALGRGLQAGIQAGLTASANSRRTDSLAALRRRLAAAGSTPLGLAPLGTSPLGIGPLGASSLGLGPGIWGGPPVLR